MISIVAGAMALAVLDAVVSRQQAASNGGGGLACLGNFGRDFLAPAGPAFATGSTTPGPSTTAAAAAPPPAALAPGGTGTPITTSPPAAGATLL